MNSLKSDKLTVYIFNVDRGDHILIELPNGEFGIIDFYYPNSFSLPDDTIMEEAPALLYLKNLKQQGKREIRIAFIHISHPDFDHTRGIDSFYKWIKTENIPLRNLWWFGGKETTKYMDSIDEVFLKVAAETELSEYVKSMPRLWKTLTKIGDLDKLADSSMSLNDLNIVNGKLMKNVNGKNIQVFNMAPPFPMIEHFKEELFEKKLSDSVRRFVYKMLEQINHVPYAEDLDVPKENGNPSSHTSPDKNLLSSALMLQYKPFKLLFGGDVHKETWIESFKVYDDRQYGEIEGFPGYDAHWHKVSHHGSHNSTNLDIWDRLIAVDPEIGSCHFSISAGYHPVYNHPRKETISDIFVSFSQKENKIRTEKKLNKPIKLDISATNNCQFCRGIRANYQRVPIKFGLDPVKTTISKYEKESKKAYRAGGYEFGMDSYSEYLDESIDVREQLGFEIIPEKGKSMPMLAALIYEFSPSEKKINLTFGINSKLVDNRTGSGKCSCVSCISL